MDIDIKMPALSPTMEEGKLSRWLVETGDKVSFGDVLGEIETDKATMEFEAVDEGVITMIAVSAGTDGVKVGTVLARLGDADSKPPVPPGSASWDPGHASNADTRALSDSITLDRSAKAGRIFVSPLAKRIAAEAGISLALLNGSGPHGRIVRADVEAARLESQGAAAPETAPAATPIAESLENAEGAELSAETRQLLDKRVPHTIEKLSGMRRTIARRLTESARQAPHIYLTIDIRLENLMALRAELNDALMSRGGRLSINDMLIKAFARALMSVPECNVAFTGSDLIKYCRADISVAVSVPGGLVTPIVQNADGRSVSSISKAVSELTARARQGSLLQSEYEGGTASISNMGMLGINQFTALINPPQATILAIGAGGQRPCVLDGALGIATVMSATGSFDHRAVDGADGARLMSAFKDFVEKPLGSLV